jgi:sulfur carrier protein ThiS
MNIYDGQMIYNAVPRYNLTSEILRTKIMPAGEAVEIIKTPNGKVAVDVNGEVVAAEKATPNWVPVALAAAVAFVAMG